VPPFPETEGVGKVRDAMATKWRILAMVLIPALVLSSCSTSILDVVKDRLPAPHEVENGYKFTYFAPSSRYVTLAGNFNNWGGTLVGRYDPTIGIMTDEDGDGVWEIVVSLPPGRYQYKYVLDGGVVWELDPNNPDTDYEGGIENSLVIVSQNIRYEAAIITGTMIGTTDDLPGERAKAEAAAQEVVEVAFEYTSDSAGEVYVAGAFNDWDPSALQLEKGDDGIFRATLELAPGQYEYKFVVDGTWIEDPANPESIDDPYGGKNSVLTVE